VDALFLDVPNPHDYVKQVKSALRPGGSFGSNPPNREPGIPVVECPAQKWLFIYRCV
jgi:tRNA A58 N-methylase Trm61